MRLPLLLSVLLLAASAVLRADLRRVDALPVTVFYSIASRGDTICAGTDTLLYVSTDRGATWSTTGRIAQGFEFLDAIHLGESGWFVASANGGVYRSLDRGATWTSIVAGLGGIGVLDLQEWNGSLYAATDGAGVYVRSLAEPATWRSTGAEFAENEAQNGWALHVHEGGLVAGAGGNGLVFVKESADSPWTSVAVAPPAQAVGLSAFDFTSDGGTLLAATSFGTFRSNDGGGRWEPTGSVLRNGGTAAFARDGETVYYTIGVRPGEGDLYRSNDSGATWEHLGALPEILRMDVCGGVLYMANLDGVRAYTPPVSSVEKGERHNGEMMLSSNHPLAPVPKR